MDTCLDFNDFFAETFSCQPKDDLDFNPPINNNVSWEDSCNDLLESFINSGGLDQLDNIPPEIFTGRSNSGDSELENAKDDFDKVLDAWQSQVFAYPDDTKELYEESALPLLDLLTSELLKDDAHDANQEVFSQTPVIGSTPENAVQVPPALEAVDVSSLLEQFEATEATFGVPFVTPAPETEAKHGCTKKNASAPVANTQIKSKTDAKKTESRHKLPVGEQPRNALGQPVNGQIRSKTDNKKVGSRHRLPVAEQTRNALGQPANGQIKSKADDKKLVSRHKLPVTEQPTFKIILKRDPQVLAAAQPRPPEVTLRDPRAVVEAQHKSTKITSSRDPGVLRAAQPSNLETISRNPKVLAVAAAQPRSSEVTLRDPQVVKAAQHKSSEVTLRDPRVVKAAHHKSSKVTASRAPRVLRAAQPLNLETISRDPKVLAATHPRSPQATEATFCNKPVLVASQPRSSEVTLRDQQPLAVAQTPKPEETLRDPRVVVAAQHKPSKVTSSRAPGVLRAAQPSNIETISRNPKVLATTQPRSPKAAEVTFNNMPVLMTSQPRLPEVTLRDQQPLAAAQPLKPEMTLRDQQLLAVAQPPKPEVTLRDLQVLPTAQPTPLAVALRDHDYCSTPHPTVVSRVCKSQTAEPSKQVSLLKPICVHKTALAPQLIPRAPTESLYSKLPDYYTSIVPPPPTNGFGSDEGGKQGESECSKLDNEVYDKLPSYLTTFSTAIVLPSTPNQHGAATKTASKGPKTGAVGNSILKCKAEPLAQALTVPAGNASIEKDRCQIPSFRSVEYKARRAKSRSPSPAFKAKKIKVERVSPERRVLPVRERHRKSRIRDRRPVSSRSPSHSVSSRSASSRSPSLSSSSSSSASSCASRSRSRSPVRRNEQRHGCRQRHRYVRRSRSRSQGRLKHNIEEKKAEEQKKQIEDRRVVHVGNVKVGTSKMDLMKRFRGYGSIEDITLHFREYDSDCFAFITFTYTCDAFEALEHGNDDPAWPKYELSLGGRRLFCLENYSDLDSLNNRRRPIPSITRKGGDSFDFDNLLKAAKDKIRCNQS